MTSNPQRKWEKKLRNATTEEQTKKAEVMLKALRPSPPKMKDTKESDEDVFNEAQKYNKQHFKDKQTKEKKEKEEKKKSFDRSRVKVTLLDKQNKKERDQINSQKEIEDYRKQYKKEEGVLNQRLKDHVSKLKVDQSDKLYILHASIMKETNNNKKKTKKIYNKIIKHQAKVIEMTIRGYMDKHQVSYEEAYGYIYSKTVQPLEEVESLQILDNCAKL
jgi:hypothetical protein